MRHASTAPGSYSSSNFRQPAGSDGCWTPNDVTTGSADGICDRIARSRRRRADGPTASMPRIPTPPPTNAPNRTLTDEKKCSCSAPGGGRRGLPYPGLDRTHRKVPPAADIRDIALRDGVGGFFRLRGGPALGPDDDEGAGSILHLDVAAQGLQRQMSRTEGSQGARAHTSLLPAITTCVPTPPRVEAGSATHAWLANVGGRRVAHAQPATRPRTAAASTMNLRRATRWTALLKSSGSSIIQPPSPPSGDPDRRIRCVPCYGGCDDRVHRIDDNTVVLGRSAPDVRWTLSTTLEP